MTEILAIAITLSKIIRIQICINVEEVATIVSGIETPILTQQTSETIYMYHRFLLNRDTFTD